MKVDLHTHTRYSDGNLTLDGILKLAKEQGLCEIAITDHDTIINLKNYSKLEDKYDIKIIPGIEIPTNIKKLHILGYGITKFDLVEDKLYKLKKYNENRNIETIEILKSDGIDISFSAVKEIATSDVITYRDIVKYMYKKGYVSNPHDVYAKFIGKGTKAYVPSKELTIEEVLLLIKSGGGFSILAHPFTIGDNIDLEELIIYMKEFGLLGIEIYPPKLTYEQLTKYKNIVKKYDLIQTIGTDFHNSNYDKLGFDVEDDSLEPFHSRVLKKWR